MPMLNITDFGSKRGRGLVADATIVTGRKLLDVSASVFAVELTGRLRGSSAKDAEGRDSELSGSNDCCSWCLLSSAGAKPGFLRCGGCKSVAYCSKEHQVMSWHAHHSYECDLLSAFRNQKFAASKNVDGGNSTERLLSVVCRLAAQIIGKIIKRRLKENLNDASNLNHSGEAWTECFEKWSDGASRESGECLRIFESVVAENLTPKDELVALSQLCCNVAVSEDSESEKEQDSYIEYSVKSLQDAVYAYGQSCLSSNSPKKLILADRFRLFSDNKELMRRLFRQILNNALSVTDEIFSPIGKGIFLGATFFNHSCSANAVAQLQHRTGPIMRIHATRLINIGEEVCISYIHVGKTTKERQLDLATIYSFACDCPLCSSDCVAALERDKCLTLPKSDLSLNGEAQKRRVLGHDPGRHTQERVTELKQMLKALLKRVSTSLTKMRDVDRNNNMRQDEEDGLCGKMLKCCSEVVERVQLGAQTNPKNAEGILEWLEEDLRNKAWCFIIYCAKHFELCHLQMYCTRQSLERALIKAGGVGESLTYAIRLCQLIANYELYGGISPRVVHEEFVAGTVAQRLNEKRFPSLTVVSPCKQRRESPTWKMVAMEHYVTARQTGVLCMGEDHFWIQRLSWR